MARKITIGKDPGPKGRKPEPSTQDNKTALRGRMFVALLNIQQTYPTIRLGQIIDNATTLRSNSPGLFFMSDEELIKALEEYAVICSHSQATENEGSRG